MAAVRIDRVRTARCNGRYSVMIPYTSSFAPFAWMVFHLLGNIFPEKYWGVLKGSPASHGIKFGRRAFTS